MKDMELLKYPIGKVHLPETITQENREEWIRCIANFPMLVETEIIGLNSSELNKKYRPDGWNIKQVVNHCIDSHLNSYVRFKLALTEDNPTIRPYKEGLWAELPDTIDYDIKESLQMLKSLHKRWEFLLENLKIKDFKKTFIHPDGDEVISLEENLCIYAWHCQHHLKHIINAKKFQYS